MDTQPPGDPSALERTVKEQTDAIAALEKLLKTELAEIRQLLSDTNRRIDSLTDISSSGYSGGEVFRSQEQDGDQMRIAENQEQHYGRDKDNPPLIPEGTLLTCVRCGYKWTPHARRPKKCPECEAPWWFPPRWRWHQS